MNAPAHGHRPNPGASAGGGGVHATGHGWQHPLARIDFDAVFTCWAFLTGLFPLYLKTLTGVFFLLLPLAFFFFRPERIVPFFKRAWPVLLIPGFAMLSTVWSVLPGVTMYYSTQFAITVLTAVIIGAALDRRQALNGAFAAFLFHCFLVVAVGIRSGTLHHDVNEGFIGFAGSKNTTADMACMGLLVGIAAVGAALHEKRLAKAVLAGILVLAETYIVYCAISAGADAAVFVSGVILAAMLCSGKLPLVARSTALCLIALAAAVAAATQKLWYHAVFEGYLHAQGKDESITGRTYIWSRAEVLYHQHPLLGRGFGAFWRNGDLESEAIWDKMYVLNRQGFNFHNSIYELLVYLGYTGLVLFAVIAAICGITLLVRTTIRIQATSCLYCAFLVYDGMRFQFEAIPLGLFSHNVLLLYAAFAAAFAAKGRPEGANYAPAASFGRRALAGRINSS
jgi:exopolysaccharide production protein ExoQ